MYTSANNTNRNNAITNGSKLDNCDRDNSNNTTILKLTVCIQLTIAIMKKMLLPSSTFVYTGHTYTYCIYKRYAYTYIHTCIYWTPLL